VIAVGPPDRLLVALPAGGVSTLAAGRVSVSLAIERPAQVRDLYRAGAWLVLPASRGACIEAARREGSPAMPVTTRPMM
jgi:hypothetical protein